MADDIEPVPEFAPGEGYEPKPGRPQPELPAPRVEVVPTAIFQAPMVNDPDDRVGARCHAHGPIIVAEGKPTELPCVRRRDHVERGQGEHRAFAGVDPAQRVWYEWH